MSCWLVCLKLVRCSLVHVPDVEYKILLLLLQISMEMLLYIFLFLSQSSASEELTDCTCQRTQVH